MTSSSFTFPQRTSLPQRLRNHLVPANTQPPEHLPDAGHPQVTRPGRGRLRRPSGGTRSDGTLDPGTCGSGPDSLGEPRRLAGRFPRPGIRAERPPSAGKGRADRGRATGARGTRARQPSAPHAASVGAPPPPRTAPRPAPARVLRAPEPAAGGGVCRRHMGRPPPIGRGRLTRPRAHGHAGGAGRAEATPPGTSGAAGAGSRDPGAQPPAL